MRCRFSWILFSVFLSCTLLRAQNPATCDDDQFRILMDAYVSEGNRQYDRSSRTGIQQMADALKEALLARSATGRLHRTDSLEYTADRLKLLGDWHYENGNYEEKSFPLAEEQFLQALSIYHREDLPFQEDLDKIPLIYRELAQLHYRQARYAEALSDISVAEAAYQSAWMNQQFEEGDAAYSTWQDIRTQKALCLARAGRSDEALEWIDGVLSSLSGQDEIYYETLRKKAKVLMLSGTQGCAAQASPLYQAFFEWRQADALQHFSAKDAVQRQEYWMRMRPFLSDCCQLEDANPELVFNSVLFTKGLLLQLNRLCGNGVADEKALNLLRSSWKDIQKKLPAESCVIEFVQYEKSDTRKMAALVLGRKGKPVWIPFAGPDAFFDYSIDGRSNRERVYSTSGKQKNPMYADKDLPSLLWNDALIAAIGSCRKIYFVPDGYLHQLALEYLLPEALAGKEFYRLSSSRRLLEKGSVDVSSALIAGGVRYNDPVPTPAGGNDSLAYDFMRGIHARFEYLAGSKTEAESIHQRRNCPADTLLTGAAATEMAVRALSPSYPVLSLSTHGYFGAAEVPQGTDLKACLEESTLSQCILALAGANRNLSDSRYKPYQADGLLSAAEIGTLDLSGVDLAIISACQTGLGMVTADGVFGIQRGLKNAGAGCMILSLWNVDDKATALFMSRFHQLLAAGRTVHTAFFEARASFPEEAFTDSSVRRLNPATLSCVTRQAATDYRLPQYTDAFLLIDAIN